MSNYIDALKDRLEMLDFFDALTAEERDLFRRNVDKALKKLMTADYQAALDKRIQEARWHACRAFIDHLGMSVKTLDVPADEQLKPMTFKEMDAANELRALKRSLAPNNKID